MDDIVKTREMELGPVRVPVMVQKKLANELATYLMSYHKAEYDETLERIIRLGLDASRREQQKETLESRSV